MDSPTPPSNEVLREQLMRDVAVIRSCLETVIAAMKDAAVKMQEFVRVWQQADMMHSADAIRDCPHETENRLVDWLRQGP